MIVIKRLICPLIGAVARTNMRLITPTYKFALMSLFQQPKKPEQLSPVFEKPTRLKGHIRYKKRKGYVSYRLNTRIRDKPQKLKNHRGMLKRVKIVGPLWNRRFKRLNTGNYHLKRKKSQSNLKRKRRPAYVSKADTWRVRRLIPYFKRKSLKNLY